MTYEPEGGWAQTPPAPLLEVLDLMRELERAAGAMYSETLERHLAGTESRWDGLHTYSAWQGAYARSARLLESALQEVYAP